MMLRGHQKKCVSSCLHVVSCYHFISSSPLTCSADVRLALSSTPGRWCSRMTHVLRHMAPCGLTWVFSVPPIQQFRIVPVLLVLSCTSNLIHHRKEKEACDELENVHTGNSSGSWAFALPAPSSLGSKLLPT